MACAVMNVTTLSAQCEQRSLFNLFKLKWIEGIIGTRTKEHPGKNDKTQNIFFHDDLSLGYQDLYPKTLCLLRQCFFAGPSC